MPIDMFKTGQAIIAHRQRLDMNQQELAGLMNVTHQAVSKWEKGQTLPDTETLLALAKLFGVSMEDLLLGNLPAEEAAEEAPAPAEEETALPSLDEKTLHRVLPFVSAKVADQLFSSYVRTHQPDLKRLNALAPFVSTRVLNEYILSQPLENCNPEAVCAIAHFLPTSTVDRLIQGLNGPVPKKLLHYLLPFASAKVVDELVLQALKTEE